MHAAVTAVLLQCSWMIMCSSNARAPAAARADALCSDGKCERAADAFLIERGLARIDPDEVRVEVRIGAEELRCRAAVRVDLAEGQDVREVKLSAAERALLRVDAVARIEVYLLQPHAAGVPVGRGFLHHDELVRLPAFQRKRTIAHQRPGFRPR